MGSIDGFYFDFDEWVLILSMVDKWVLLLVAGFVNEWVLLMVAVFVVVDRFVVVDGS